MVRFHIGLEPLRPVAARNEFVSHPRRHKPRLYTRIMPWTEKIFAGDWPSPVQSVAGTIVIAVFVVTFLAQAFTIPSESMEQTLLIGDYLLVDKFCFGENAGNSNRRAIW